jgi:hypothetical protein
MDRPSGKVDRLLTRFAFALLPIGALALALAAGCGKSPSEPVKPSAAPESNSPAETAPAQITSALTGPGKDQKSCFRCGGLGTVACAAPGCRGGKVDCPGPCLKLSRGSWVHMNVTGHSPSELWQKFPDSDGRAYQAWSQRHVGQVIVMQNGKAVNIGPCKICGGTGKVNCPVCRGEGAVTCEICDGKMFIPIAWTPSDNPWLNRQPDVIRLKDGRVILGKIVISSGDDRGIKTRDGHFLHVDAAEIVSKSDSNSPPVAPASSP